MSLTPDQFRARTAFLRFQCALDNLEQSLKPLRPEMSLEMQHELGRMRFRCLGFFDLANQELFSQSNPAARAERRMG